MDQVHTVNHLNRSLLPTASFFTFSVFDPFANDIIFPGLLLIREEDNRAPTPAARLLKRDKSEFLYNTSSSHFLFENREPREYSFAGGMTKRRGRRKFSFSQLLFYEHKHTLWR